jgi:ferredoxin/flavodoxin---NADP+ reductase
MSELGTETRPLRVAIIGSGPSGFYAADHLLKSDCVCMVDMFERLPTPFGLVRSGVAPDHDKIRSVTALYERIAKKDGFSYLGNVEVGFAVTVKLLQRHYDALIFSTGTETSVRLGIPGEDLPNSHKASSFVCWYNGHPEYRHLDFDLSQEVAVIIGAGNVAMDVARMLCQHVDSLRHTDITQNALDAFAESKIKEVHVIARRGPAQAKYTQTELSTIERMDTIECVTNDEEMALNKASHVEAEDVQVQRVLGTLQNLQGKNKPNAKSSMYLRFLLSPVKILGRGCVESLILERNMLVGKPFEQRAKGTGEIIQMPCGLVFHGIGFRGSPIPGVPFNQRIGTIINEEGRVMDDGKVMPGLYAAGWIKTGPRGLIGNNKPNAAGTVKKLLEDVPNLKPCPIPSSSAMRRTLRELGIRVVSFDEWHKIDAAEKERGKAVGKHRERFTRISHMLAVLDQ